MRKFLEFFRRLHFSMLLLEILILYVPHKAQKFLARFFGRVA